MVYVCPYKHSPIHGTKNRIHICSGLRGFVLSRATLRPFRFEDVLIGVIALLRIFLPLETGAVMESRARQRGVFSRRRANLRRCMSSRLPLRVRCLVRRNAHHTREQLLTLRPPLPTPTRSVADGGRQPACSTVCSPYRCTFLADPADDLVDLCVVLNSLDDGPPGLPPVRQAHGATDRRVLNARRMNSKTGGEMPAPGISSYCPGTGRAVQPVRQSAEATPTHRVWASMRSATYDFAVAPGIICVSVICQFLGFRHMLNRGWALIRTHVDLQECRRSIPHPCVYVPVNNDQHAPVNIDQHAPVNNDRDSPSIDGEVQAGITVSPAARWQKDLKMEGWSGV